MKENFNDYQDLLSYLRKSDKSPENKVLNLSKCNFCFNLEMGMLFFWLKEEEYNFTYLSFRDSNFQNSVNLFLGNQKSIKDQNTNLIDYEYSKTKIDFAIDFRGCHFFDTVEFSGAEFCRDIYFNNTIFEKEVKFSELVFKSYLRLFGTSFHANALLSEHLVKIIYV